MTMSRKPMARRSSTAFRRPLAIPLLIVLALLLTLLALFFFPSLSVASSGSASAAVAAGGASPAPVKLHVYSLPTKFTYGVIRSYVAARDSTAAAAANPADSNLAYPGHQHAAEWWLFSDLLRLSSANTSPSPFIRVVADPADADLFYVPFFSSLSLIVNPIRPGSSASPASTYSDEAMQEELMEWLEGQETWRRYGGRDHVFICQDPNALYQIIGRISRAVLLVSDFGRLRPDEASLVKDVILPYSHRINSFKGEVGVNGRPSLLFFMGNRYRKEGGKIRDILFKILENEKDVIIKHGAQSMASRRVATQGMHSSKFCLHPAGDTPSACRLFDAIVSLCIPVIVSDFIELPFEDAIDYQKIAIFVETQKAVDPGYLTSTLRKIDTEQILTYQREIKKVKHYFEYNDPNGPVNEIWRQVASKLHLIKLLTNRDKRLVGRGANETECSSICSHTKVP